MQDYALELVNVSRQFGAIKALEEVNFRIKAGEVMALVGENGAGKSSSVRIMSGFDTGFAGEMRRNGKPIRFTSPSDADRNGVAIAQQELSQIGTMSVAANIFLANPHQPSFATEAKLAKLARPYLEQVGLGHVDPRQLIAGLSVGERHLVEVARLMSRQPDVLILDEPTAALGHAESQKILAMVRRLSRTSGKAIIYVSHRMDEIFQIADQITVMRDGRSQEPVPTASLTVPTLVERMLGRPLENMFPERQHVKDAPALITIKNLWADGMVSPATLSVRPGEILGLAGQLGSGASHFMAAAAGANPNRGGSIIVNGTEVLPKSPRQVKNLGIAYCSSDRKDDGLFLDLPIHVNLNAPDLKGVSQWGWLSKSKQIARANKICEAMTIDTGRLGARSGVLSGGNQQKVALGKWLSIEPRVLLVDEPTRGVDVGARAEIYIHLRRLAESGMAIIVASTDIQEVAFLPDTVATFYRGRMIDTFPNHGDLTHRILKQITHPFE